MASYCAVAVAAFFQIILRTSFFIEQSSDVCSTAPTLASWIFLLAFLDALLDFCVYPVRYMHLPYICQITAETIVTVLLAEFGTLVVWCKIEKITCKLCKSILLLIGMSPDFYKSWESYILGTATTTISLAILLFVAQATDHLHVMRKRSIRLCRQINAKSLQVWNKFYTLWKAAKRPVHCKAAAVPSSNVEAMLDLDTEMYNVSRINNRRSRGRAKRSRSRSRNRR